MCVGEETIATDLQWFFAASCAKSRASPRVL